MNQSTQSAIRHLFQVPTLEAVSREQLEKFVDEYPCFGFGHYLLSRKLRTESATNWLTVTRKTNLYFSNPFWLQWLLENTPEPGAKPIPAAAPAPQDRHSAPDPIPHPFIAEPAPAAEQTLPVEQTSLVEQGPLAEQAPVAEQLPEPAHDQTPPFVADETDPDTASSAAELLLESIERAKTLRDSLQKINEDFQSTQEPIQDEEPPFVLDEPEQPLEPKQPLDTAPAPTIDTAPVAETTPLFEPLHTIDYFASQGIRLTLEDNPTDTLGRQLKSFTEWLRTMRRLPQKNRDIIPDRVAEQTVQNFAAHSIEGKEPVTETMAEVLVKQGMPERARVVYEKLSLLNPDKSAYFAAKIEQLNTH